jgi:hypothetical protein
MVRRILLIRRDRMGREGDVLIHSGVLDMKIPLHLKARD